jgi:plastocyanin
VLVSASLYACGGTDDSPSTASTPAKAETTPEGFESAPTSPQGFPLMDDRAFDSQVRMAADPDREFSYYLSEASASPGRVTVEFVNPQSTPHNLAIEAPNGKTIGETKPVSEGKSTTEVVLHPGVYVVYCSLSGHRKAGMKGHLTVK